MQWFAELCEHTTLKLCSLLNWPVVIRRCQALLKSENVMVLWGVCWWVKLYNLLGTRTTRYKPMLINSRLFSLGFGKRLSSHVRNKGPVIVWSWCFTLGDPIEVTLSRSAFKIEERKSLLCLQVLNSAWKSRRVNCLGLSVISYGRDVGWRSSLNMLLYSAFLLERFWRSLK